MDNTLVYSDEAHISAYNEALEKIGLKKKNKIFLKKLFGMPHHQIAKILLQNAGSKKTREFLNEHHRIFMHKTKIYVKSIPGVKKTLFRLKKDYDVAVLSNCSKETILATLKSAEINPKLFKILIGSDQVKKSKPYPDEILKAEKLEHHKPEFMIGDSIYDVIAGKKAKVKTIAVLTGNYPRNELKKYNPDFMINSVNFLPKLLKKINNK